MTINIIFTDGSSRLLNTTSYFDPHNYQTDGNRHESNLHAIISDLSKGRTIYRVTVDCPRMGRILDRMPNPMPVKLSYAKTKEDREECKRVKKLVIQDITAKVTV